MPEKGRRKEDTGGGDELAADKPTGKVQKRQDTERGYQKRAGTRDYLDRQNRENKADVVQACNKNGGNKGNRLSAVALY